MTSLPAAAPPAFEASRPPRRSDIDALRVIAVLLLVYFHSGMVFNLWQFHIKNAQLSRPITLFTTILGQWHMPLFMLLAGASTYLALRHRSPGQYAGERVRRLLVPLIFGMLIVVPPQVYIERISWSARPRMSPINFTGAFFHFYPHVFEGVYPHGNLSWHHLWFVAYLLTYSLALLPLLIWLKRSPTGRRAVEMFGRIFSPGLRILLLGLPLVVIEAALGPLFPRTHALIDDWCNHAHYILVFLYGYLLISDDRLWEAIDRSKIAAMMLGLACTTASLTGRLQGWGLYTPGYFPGVLLWSCGEWCWLVALLGFGREWLNRPNPCLGYAATVAYPFYVLHQTVIVILAWYIVRWNRSIAAKFALLSSVAVLATAALCETARHSRVTRFLLGMGASRRPVGRLQPPCEPPSPN